MIKNAAPLKRAAFLQILLAVFTVLAFGLMPARPVAGQQLSYSPEAADMYQNAMGALRMRRLSLARQQLKEVIEKYPDDVHATIARRQLAAVMRDQKEYDQAIELLNDIIKTDKSEDNIRMAREDLLNLLYELQRFKQGVELIEEWRKAQPNDMLLGRHLAKFYLQVGRKDEAWLLLESMVEAGTVPAAFGELLDLAVRTAEVEKLLQTLESRRTRYRSNVFAEYASDCYLALGRKDKAIEVIMEVTDLPNHLMLLRKLADLQIETDAIEKAVGTLDLILRILPDDWATLRKIGHCHFIQGRKTEAVATWRRPLNRPYMPAREFFTEFTVVLIEHQLYDEALKAFEEARVILQDVTLFSEEKATVLDALGKHEQALEEYLHVLAAGVYKPEIFAKLYEAKIPNFKLETRLLQMRAKSNNPAIMQALLEFYFLRAELEDINKIAAIIGDSAGSFDYAFYDRLKQEALLIPTSFHFDLTEKVIKSRPESSLELMLAGLLLRMAPHDDTWEDRAYNAATAIAKRKGVADAQIKATLLLDLARFALEQRNDTAAAHAFTDGILQGDLLRAVPELNALAGLFKAKLLIFEEKYAAAESLLREVGKKLQNPDFEVLQIGAAARQDQYSLCQLEMARLTLHQGDYQKALTELKKIVEETTEGDYVNDALEMALYITRRSIGDFDLLKRSLKAERLAMTGKYPEAIAELREAISKNASATALVSEMQADVLLLRRTSSATAELLKDIDSYVAEHPEGFKTADILEFRLKILTKQAAPKAEIRESLQSFVETFPSDLRSCRYRKILANMQSHGGKEENK